MMEHIISSFWAFSLSREIYYFRIWILPLSLDSKSGPCSTDMGCSDPRVYIYIHMTRMSITRATLEIIGFGSPLDEASLNVWADWRTEPSVKANQSTFVLGEPELGLLHRVYIGADSCRHSFEEGPHLW